MHNRLRGVISTACLLVLAPLSAAQAQDTNALRAWREYRTIMWIGDSAYKQPDKVPLFFRRLREMGVNTGMVGGDGDLRPLLDNKFPYYVENMVNRGLCLKWNSKVRDWEKVVTDWAQSGRPESALVRDYCLDDPQWRAWARREMQQLVRKNREPEPLAYDVRDELSTTISANPFDYDFNPKCLAAFREWLKTQYSDLKALNSEWETKFSAWDEVKPFTTDQIKNRMASGDALARGKPDWQQLQSMKFEPNDARQTPTRWNFSPWADFRTYMDSSLAAVLSDLRQAARELDSRTPVGIEGTQMPHAFGGYDLWRLSQALDWVEPYDIGNAREIFGSFMPGGRFLTTVFEPETQPARRRLWHLLLEGDRGCIIWWSEDCIDWKSSGYQLTAKARALTPVLNEMTSPLAKIFLNAERERDPIYLHYSQPSIQVDWLLESTIDGSTWLRRFSSYEAEHNRQAKARNGWLKAFQDLGFSPVFVSSAQLEGGALSKSSDVVLVLPQSWALSDKEAAPIRLLAHGAGRSSRVFCEATPGLFNEHGRLRPQNALGDLVPLSASGTFAVADGRARSSQGGGAQYAADRLKGKMDWANWIASCLGPIRAEVTLPPSARARIHRFRLGTNRLLAFERNINYQMSEELKQAGGNEPLEKPVEIEATLSQAAHVYDLRAQKYLGHADRFRFTLDPWQPSLFALLRETADPETIVSKLAGQ
ncbi:MAG TPA: beta-galactosidase [Verrucomicrobiae bacterium]